MNVAKTFFTVLFPAEIIPKKQQQRETPVKQLCLFLFTI